MHLVLSDARAMRYWSTPPHQYLDQTRAWLRRMIDNPPEESFDFVIEHEGRVIGKAGMWQLPEIGFILHPDFWGQGFAREALEAVIAEVFARFPVPRISADVDPRNAACLRLLPGLGFQETGRARNTWHVGGEWCDSVYLARARGPG